LPKALTERDDSLAEFVAECDMPTNLGVFRMRSYRWVDVGGSCRAILEGVGDERWG
jgi:hypothetical protein